MRLAHTVEQIRAAEAALMATLPEGALMQRAASGLAVACAELMGGVYGARILVLAGAGNNGGDALFAGARLARRGARVDVLPLADQLHAEAMAELHRHSGQVAASPVGYDLVLDGIVGIGGRAGLRPEAADVIGSVDAPIVAVDVPSGVAVDTGEVDGDHVDADLTVTFGTYKLALLVDPAAAAAGVLELVDIGLGPYLAEPAAEALQQADVRCLLPRPGRAAHKYTRGVLGVSAGSPEYAGAGLLATSAAVRLGLAGMVRYSGPSADLVRARHPEVVAGAGQVQAWVVGPGLGDEGSDDVRRIIGAGVPVLVDADGLRHVPERFSTPAVLTPHAGELARMLGIQRSEVEAHQLRSATTAAQRWNAVVLLKGSRSVIAAPDGRVRVNTTGVPWLATAGAGDVLSGAIGSLLAAGLGPFDAASVGSWLHGAAATIASAGGPVAALDVADALPAAVRAVLT